MVDDVLEIQDVLEVSEDKAIGFETQVIQKALIHEV